MHQLSPPTISKPDSETTSSHKPYPTAASSLTMNSKYHIPITSNTLFLGSLQAHCMKKPILGGGYSSALGTTDLGLPKIVIEYD